MTFRNPVRHMRTVQRDATAGGRVFNDKDRITGGFFYERNGRRKCHAGRIHILKLAGSNSAIVIA